MGRIRTNLFVPQGEWGDSKVKGPDAVRGEVFDFPCEEAPNLGALRSLSVTAHHNANFHKVAPSESLNYRREASASRGMHQRMCRRVQKVSHRRAE